MSSDWPCVRLGDHVNSCLGKMLDKNKNKGTNQFYLGNSNVRWGDFDLSDLSLMKFEEEEHERYGIKAGDLIVCEGGEPGRCAIWTEQLPDMKIQKALHRIRPKPTLDNHYLYYWFLYTGRLGLLEPYFTGTTIKHLTGKALKNLEIQLPPVSHQKYVAEILGSLDSKIRHNTQTNETLEKIAQAIFKSWFVDFEPVKAKMAVLAAGGTAEQAELAAMSAISAKDEAALKQLQTEQPNTYAELAQTAALFPSAMEDSELGEIPAGWSATNFGSVSECFDRKRIPLSKRQREKRQGNIPYYGATSIMDYVDEPIFDDIYLLLGEDGSVLKEDGTPFVQYIWGPSWVNNHAHVLQGRNGVGTEQLMLFISAYNITAYVTGAVQLKLNQKNMNSIPFIKATDAINEKFRRLINPYFAFIRNSSEECKSLAESRDSLLPKLLSGEIELSNVDNRVEAVA